jgi:small subunit ribosomal protein S16
MGGYLPRSFAYCFESLNKSESGRLHSRAQNPCQQLPNRRRIALFFEFRDNNMVVIRLARGGAHKRPFYNMVVADSRRAAGGKFIERVGFYDPKAPEGRENLRVAMDRLRFWQGKGAQLSPTVARLVKQFGKKVAAPGAAAAA